MQIKHNIPKPASICFMTFSRIQ